MAGMWTEGSVGVWSMFLSLTHPPHKISSIFITYQSITWLENVHIISTRWPRYIRTDMKVSGIWHKIYSRSLSSRDPWPDIKSGSGPSVYWNRRPPLSTMLSSPITTGSGDTRPIKEPLGLFFPEFYRSEGYHWPFHSDIFVVERNNAKRTLIFQYAGICGTAINCVATGSYVNIVIHKVKYNWPMEDTAVY